MDIEAWWPRLSGAAQQWLIENNGDVVPPAIIDEIQAAAGGAFETLPADSPDEGLLLPDEATEWIEATANGEQR